MDIKDACCAARLACGEHAIRSAYLNALHVHDGKFVLRDRFCVAHMFAHWSLCFCT